jgi:hypothetical protein
MFRHPQPRLRNPRSAFWRKGRIGNLACALLQPGEQSRSRCPCPDNVADILLDSKLGLRFNHRAMQTLGLSESTPRAESRLKSLFWPSIQTSSDVDYLGAQGFWVCTIVAVISVVVLIFRGNSILGPLIFLFYFIGCVGVRERSRYAAAVVLLMYIADAAVGGHSVAKILIAAMLFSNLRATWIASSWKSDSEAAILPPRLGDTWSDKFADKLPAFLWPNVRVVYCVFSAGLLTFIAFGLAVLFSRRLSH